MGNMSVGYLVYLSYYVLEGSYLTRRFTERISVPDDQRGPRQHGLGAGGRGLVKKDQIRQYSVSVDAHHLVWTLGL